MTITSRTRAYLRALALCACSAGAVAQPQPGVAVSAAQGANTLRNAVAVVGGNDFFCALTSTGAVLCWGNNDAGQLGIGTRVSSSVPVTVTGLGAGVSTIVAGELSACAVTTTGALKCWGANGSGQLGDGSVENKLTPIGVDGLGSGVQSATMGAQHSCALVTGGAVKCWGFNGSGQIGNNSNVPSSLPLNVTGLGGGVLSIDAGSYHTCARFAGTTPQCWGTNNFGQLGDGGTNNSLVPKAMTVVTGAVDKIEAGQNTTCVLAGGALRCWGDNSFGKLGNGTTTNSLTPVTPTGTAANVRDVISGYLHTCALRTDGAAACWGYNIFGSLGSLRSNASLEPVLVTAARGLVDIAISINTSCAVSEIGAVTCWGHNDSGQLGNGTSAASSVPTFVQRGGMPATTVEAGPSNTCAILGGTAKCWGSNNNLALGDGSTFPRRAPTTVTAMNKAVAVSPGFGHSCGLDVEGAVQCWGINDRGQLGTPAFITATLTGVAPVGLGIGVEKVSSSLYHTCALRAGSVYCWGASEQGQTSTPGSVLNTPKVVALSGAAKDIDLGFHHSCALMSSGAVYCWGQNSNLQLGSGSSVTSALPLLVNSLPAARQVSAGGYHTCALDANGGVWCWGWNGYGQLGNNTLVNNPTPVNAQGLTAGVQAITTGDGHSCALTSGGGVKCWGRNDLGQLGTNSLALSSTVPVDVQGLSSGVVAISSADEHTCARMTDGALRCWGDGFLGQLGDGNAWSIDGVNASGFIAGRALMPLVSNGARQESEPNNNSAEANPIGRDTPLRVSVNDTYDVFVFDSASAGAISVDLTGVPADVASRMQIQLYYQTTSTASRVADDPLAPFSITYSGPAGRYYIVVFVDGVAFNPAQTFELVARYP
jgi:alpha-tubulin suppressor-like RCC1 family protein